MAAVRRHSFIMRSAAVVIIIGLLTILSSGCMTQVKRNLAETAASRAIVGVVSDYGHDPSKIVVVAFKEENGTFEPYNYTHLNSFGRFVLRVQTNQTYIVMAFTDFNNNLQPDDGGLVGIYADRIVADNSAEVYSIRLSLKAEITIPVGLKEALPKLTTLVRKPLPIAIGEIADLSDERFSAENGKRGLWEFFDFITNTGIGVYFLEPYDPAKIPVLFVNGAGGSPQDWSYFFKHLDRNKYQPWFFLYPSGASLESSASTLNSIITRLHQKYNFSQLYVTAHSMGGLLSRAFINKSVFDDKSEYIKLFVSLSTPWHGHSGAKYGVDIAPATIPSWIDMVPGSEFQNSIFSKTLGSAVDYYLLFGYRGGPSVFSEYNDGTVSLSSQLYFQAQREAKKIMGFNEGHISILANKEVFNSYCDILERTYTLQNGRR